MHFDFSWQRFSWQRFFHTTIIKYFLSTNFIFRVSKNVSYWPQIHAQRKIVQLSRPSSLTHFQPMFNFYTLWKHQKTRGFWCFQGVQKWNIGWKWVKYASWKHTDSRETSWKRTAFSELNQSLKSFLLQRRSQDPRRHLRQRALKQEWTAKRHLL